MITFAPGQRLLDRYRIEAFVARGGMGDVYLGRHETLGHRVAVKILHTDEVEFHVLGTPDYMAPEQVLGDPVDARADIYATGICIFEMISGRLPYRDAQSGGISSMLDRVRRVAHLKRFVEKRIGHTEAVRWTELPDTCTTATLPTCLGQLIEPLRASGRTS